jgi:hypothetical protein
VTVVKYVSSDTIGAWFLSEAFKFIDCFALLLARGMNNNKTIRATAKHNIQNYVRGCLKHKYIFVETHLPAICWAVAISIIFNLLNNS